MITKTESRKLNCLLSEDELLQRGNELAKTYIEIAALDLQKKRITSQIKPLDERIEALVVIIDTKEEERSVACEWQPNFAEGIKRLRRLDTYEVIDTREIRDYERQQQFELETSPKVDEGLALGAEEPQPDLENVCYNTSCLKFHKGADNHCLELQYTSDCPNPKGTGAPKGEDDAGSKTEEAEEGSEARNEVAGSAAGAGADEQVAVICSKCKSEHPNCDECCNSCHKNQICKEAQFCTLTGHDSICAVCTGECNDYTPGTAINECPGFLAPSPAGELQQAQAEDQQSGPISINILLDAGFSHNATKLLVAGFSLVSYDRENKTIYVTAPNLRDGWVALDPFTTYAQAERALDKMLEDPGVVGIARNKKGSITQGAKHLHAFTFYRSEGIMAGHGTPLIKKGPNWTTWKKFDTAEECAAAWENLLTNDLKALED